MSQTARQLLVDGCNVMHAWPELTDLMRSDLVAAAHRLLDDVRLLHDTEGWHTTVVIDGRGSRVAIEHPTQEATLSLVYTPAGLTADAYIEQVALRMARTGPCTVVTRDRALGETIFAAGATPMSPASLRDWIDRAATRQRQRLRQRSTQAEPFRNGLFD